MEKDKNKDKEIGSASLFIDGRAVSVSGSISRTPEHQTIIPTASVGSVSLGSVSTHLSSNINFDERWEFYDSSDIAALIASIKIEISSFNDNPENPSDKVIRKLAERYSVFWGSLKKFIRKDDTLSKTIAHKLFKDLVKYFDGVALNTSSDRILDNISLINRISNKKMDAIIIDFHYPVDKKISDYKKDIVKGHEVLEKAWHEFWKKYPDFVRYFVLALITVDHHVNGFLPSKHLFLYGDKILQEKNRNYYFENMKFTYNLLQRTGNKELSWNILIIFLNNTSKIAYQKNHWRQIADYIERDFPPKIKIIMNNFLRNIADLCPDNEQTQYIKRIIEPTNLDAVTDFDGRILNTRFEHDVIPFFEEEENETLEFKQTFSFNTRTGKQKCEDIRYAALKEIVGFLNTGSGCLVIGIHDKTKEIIGIEEDGFKGDRDKYSLQINDIVATSCGETAASLLSIQFHEVSGRTVCKVLCKKSEEPIYCKFKNHQESPFVRTGSSTRKPDYKEWDKFRRQHFPKNSV